VNRNDRNARVSSTFTIKMLFGLFGKLTAHEGKRDALLEKMMKAADLMNSVPGCLLYVVATSDAEPNAVFVTELWKDEDSHGASLSMAGVRNLIVDTMPLLAEQPSGTKVKAVGGKGLDALTSSKQA
jgi:quinol monooxygenase YgiN